MPLDARPARSDRGSPIAGSDSGSDPALWCGPGSYVPCCPSLTDPSVQVFVSVPVKDAVEQAVSALWRSSGDWLEHRQAMVEVARARGRGAEASRSPLCTPRRRGGISPVRTPVPILGRCELDVPVGTQRQRWSSHRCTLGTPVGVGPGRYGGRMPRGDEGRRSPRRRTPVASSPTAARHWTVEMWEGDDGF
jgi:hypothetical protein